MPACLRGANLVPSNWSSRLECYDEMNVTCVKRRPPQRRRASWWAKREKPSAERVFSTMRVSILLLRQLIRCTSFTNLPALSLPPTTNIESLIRAARWPVLPANHTGVACTPLRLDEKFISILNITIHQINNQYIPTLQIAPFTLPTRPQPHHPLLLPYLTPLLKPKDMFGHKDRSFGCCGCTWGA